MTVARTFAKTVACLPRRADGGIRSLSVTAALLGSLVCAPALQAMGFGAALPCGPQDVSTSLVGPRAEMRTSSMLPDSSMLALFKSGQTFPDFLAAAKARREGWLRLADSAVVSDALVARARAVGGTWHLMIIAIDSCGDSMNSVPYVAKLASQVPGLELRIVLPTAGKAVQERFRSLDGRATTPTFILLDETGHDRGCITELPKGIRGWATSSRAAKMPSDSLRAGINAFYVQNRGESIVTETIEMMEAARRGAVVCERGA
ncbi:MAG TPA: thioredoxin family protein [Gemmatimonas aurantiaca]|uniref:Thioredoxin family protein n=2 Tax=Gemmatimonas aurantiaca TaxID=173480 RepID=C1A9N6_GEMAT|nr:thioredoxin family protein [Gemmatimonas aurantiaca]BAH39213.1 hypothetical protein GAU_2171 [Gemmatimonas aurantiaca T-27]HCT57512.1 thioredoxin family protein [Gemmatimonas aurantiaca]